MLLARWPDHLEGVSHAAAGALATARLDALERALEEERARARALEERLQRAERLEALGLLSAGVAHDYNNVLAGISGCCDLLLRLLPREAPVAAYVREMRLAATRGASLSAELVDFARGRPRPKGPIHLDALITSQERFFRALLGENIELGFTLAAGELRVPADEGELQQALLNLLSNARQAMPTGGRLTIETRRLEVNVGQSVALTVRDTGCGMDPETAARVMEPFFTTRGGRGGTGLGLAMVQRIAERHGGVVEVESAPGMGTAVRLRFPAC